MSKLKLVFVIFCAITISACSPKVIRHKLTSTPVDLSNYKVNPMLDPKMETFEWNIPNEWGLALSGGGVRAAFYSVGVLKALERGGILKSIDIISSVSGGGYAAYWLFSDPSLPSTEFGAGRLAAENFPKSMCQLLTTGNFVTNPSAVRNIHRSSDNYEEKIFRTFGPHRDVGAVEAATPISMRNFSDQTSQKIPYHIVNTTDNEKLPWKFKLFEFTPLAFGNYVLPNSMTEWSYVDNESQTPYLKTVSISGAALDMIAQAVTFESKPDPESESEPEVKSYILSDGGNTENLGAYALIRRGVKNIIIVDAEHNPNYEFSAYKQLKRQLADDGFEFSVPEVDEFIRYQPIYKELDPKLHKFRLFNSAFTGYVKNIPVAERVNQWRQPYTAKIYYIKMSNSRSADLFARTVSNSEMEEGEKIYDGVYKYLIDKAAETGEKQWNCNALTTESVQAMGEKDALENWFKYTLSAYTEAFPGFLSVKLLNMIPKSSYKSDFPQYTTVDQSYYPDQAIAFMALGYFSTLEIRPEIIETLKQKR